MENISRYSPDLAGASKDDIFYALTMFPYPSGSGLHCGHASVMTINDVLARYQRMQGKVVFQPFGFDAFGLPTENYAMKVGKPAYEVTETNKQKFIDQLKALNLSFDRERVIDTSKPDYYKWTQRIFQQLYKAGLVYRDELWVNRCPDCQTVLANDQVVEGKCERCKHEIVQKKMPQWFIKITDYADRLLEDLETIDRPEETKTGQRNWIGKSVGAEIDFEVQHLSPALSGEEREDVVIRCFTTRPDTIYGVTALVLAPENTMLDELLDDTTRKEVNTYRQQALAKTAVQRQQDAKDKTGVESGVFALHPLTGEQLPIWFADYVLADYGSGAVMMVPAHDERDGEFAEKFGIEIREVIVDESPLPIPLLGGEGTVKDASLRQYKATPEYIVDLAKTLRTKQTSTEHVFREIVRAKRFYDTKWRRQHPFGRYIADFYCHTYKLAIELDGVTHDSIEAQAYDAIRTEFINNYDVVVLRFSNDDISTNLDGVFEKIADHMNNFSLLAGESEREVFTGYGILIHSENYTGLDSETAKQQITDHLESLGKGRSQTTYKLRDWSVSRQRYWGSPIPVYYDEDGNEYLIPEEELPVELPLDVANYKPKGKSPLEDHPTFPVYEKDGKKYRRECDTLDTFMCSSFYFLRYPDAHNDQELISKALAEKLFPIESYTGGKEHTVGHLLYARFIHKFLYDQGYVPSSEPVTKLIHQGMVLGADGRKMGKRYGNGVDPLEVISQYGADAVRTYLMFMGPVEQDKIWNDSALNGVKKFLDRVERLLTMDRRGEAHETVESVTHQTIQGITYDMQKMKYNTAVSKLMILVNTIYEHKSVTTEQLETLTLLLSPFATELAEKMWGLLGHGSDVHFAKWPIANVSKIQQSSIKLPIQINGKVRGTAEVAVGTTEEGAVAAAKALENIQKWVDGKEIVKVIYVQDKILNIIIK